MSFTFRRDPNETRDLNTLERRLAQLDRLREMHDVATDDVDTEKQGQILNAIFKVAQSIDFEISSSRAPKP
jgi:hypothetical protein